MNTFNQCLRTLRNSKNDNERLASLMVISKLTSTVALNKAVVNDLFDAVSTQFLQRMLKKKSLTKHDDDDNSKKQGDVDENSVMFRQLAVNILSIICKTNAVLVAHDNKLLCALLSVLSDFAEEGNKNSMNLFVDLTELLAIVASVNQGRKYLIENEIYSLFCPLLSAEEIREKVKVVFVQILGTNSEEEIDQKFLSVLHRKAECMQSTQEIDKFKDLDIVLELLEVVTGAHLEIDVYSNTLCTNIVRCLSTSAHDILKSKVKAIYKQKVIVMLSCMLKVFDTAWLLDKDVTRLDVEVFVLLLLTSVSVEVAFALNVEKSFNELTELRKVVHACFYIEKAMLACICSDSFATGELAKNGTFIIKVFNSFKNTLSAVYTFVQQPTIESELDHFVVLESLSMVAVWATEETENLQEELKSAIPLLMKAADKCLESSSEIADEYFGYLLPCVAQLLPDKSKRRILIKHQCLPLIQQYYLTMLSRVQSEVDDNKAIKSLECTLHIVHEFLILDYGYCEGASWEREHLEGLSKLCMDSVSCQLPVISMFSVCELLAVVLRLSRLTSITTIKMDFDMLVFIPKALDFMATLTNEVMDFENSLDEIWCVAMQALSDVVQHDKDLRDSLKKSYDFEGNFPHHKKEYVDIIDQLKTAVWI